MVVPTVAAAYPVANSSAAAYPVANSSAAAYPVADSSAAVNTVPVVPISVSSVVPVVATSKDKAQPLPAAVQPLPEKAAAVRGSCCKQ